MLKKTAFQAGRRGCAVFRCEDGGADRDRTCDTHNAIVVLYQLSYDPIQSDG